LVADDRARDTADGGADDRAARRRSRLIADHGADRATHTGTDDRAFFLSIEHRAGRQAERTDDHDDATGHDSLIDREVSNMTRGGSHAYRTNG